MAWEASVTLGALGHARGVKGSLCGERAFREKAVSEESCAKSLPPSPTKGQGAACLLGGFICDPSAGACGPRSVSHPEGHRPDCLAGEVESAIALGLDMLLGTVGAKDA